jgi:threonine aldolase
VRFYSDNTAPACPEIFAAIAEANHGSAKAYGDDDPTMQLHEAFSHYFGKEVKAFAVATGTAANSLSLATLSPPYGAIFAHQDAHVYVHECGATEFFSGGARIVTVPGAAGKVTADALAATLDRHPASSHSVQPAGVSLSQATEVGTTYTPAELAAVTELAHRRNLKVHMDGARFANSVEFLGCAPADVTWKAGVDILSFGATKNGAIGAEAVVFFDLGLVRDFELRRKRAGHLLSKSRFVSVQLLAYLKDDLWRRNAARSNGLAQKIGTAAGKALLYPVESNQVFLNLGAAGKKRLRDAGFEFHDWGSESTGFARFVVSWDQAESDVAALCAALSR